MKRKVSVIMPVYNSENTVVRAIDSIINQKFYTNIELIIVNNGSSDLSDTICREKARKDERIKYINLIQPRGE